MSQGVIADNWSLQEVTGLLSDGLANEDAGEIILRDGIHQYRPISSAIIQTEAFFDLLTDIVLRDEIIVDEQFTHAWETAGSPILQVKKSGVLRPYSFMSEQEKISGPTDRIVNHLCTTESLRMAHERNVDGWDRNKAAPDGLLSATLWGGAGMCARSFVYEKGYTPHPLRKRLFINSGFMLPAEDALHQVDTFINDSRLKVLKKVYGDDILYSSCIIIPAIPIRVIQESNSPSDMISVALQMRDEFRELREWLKMFQMSMGEGDLKALARYRLILESVGSYVDRRLGDRSSKSSVSMEAGYGIFKLATTGNPIESIKNQFGIRATLNRLIFSESAGVGIKRYVEMFGEKGSEVGYEIERSFSK